jgi:uncharacterized protein YuzE
MNVKYFPDTDTALIVLSAKPVVETKEGSENIYIDLDAEGRVVGLTIEHAEDVARMPAFAFELIGKTA